MKKFGALQAAGLQIAPGVANLVVYTLLAFLFSKLGLPALLALAGAVLVAEVPLSWWIMRRVTKHETGGTFKLEVAFPWRAAIPFWQYVLIGLPLVVFGVVVVGAMTPAISATIRESLDLGVPAWFLLEPDPTVFSAMSREVMITLWLASLVVFAGVGGFTQELYARGFLLPRTNLPGALAPAFNAVMFAVFHLNAPWSWPGFVILALPWAFLTWWKRSVKFGLFGHVGMLLVQSLLMAAIVFGMVSVERMTG